MICEKCLGKLSYKKKQTATNFCVSCRDASIVYRCSQSANCYVYKLTDKRGKCLYVGATYNPMQRFTAHAKDKRFWLMVLVKGFTNWSQALRYEAELTKKLKPVLNRYALSEATLDDLKPLNVVSVIPTPNENKFIPGQNSGIVHPPVVHPVAYCKPCSYGFRYELYELSFIKG